MAVQAIETSALAKRYGSRTAVDGLDLAVPAGAVTGFVGPNGAGKTTTIRMLLGLMRPSSGTGSVLGRPLDRPAEFLPRVGALVDGPALYRRLSGRANLEVLERLAGVRGRADAVLEMTGMTERAGDPVAAYSMGMRQRLAIAAALLPAPELVVLDEPTNGLDPAGIREIRALLRRLADDGATVFVSSHQLSELEQICDHVVLLRDGRLMYQGRLAALLARQPTTIVAAPEDPADAPALLDIAARRGWDAEQTERGVEVTSTEAVAGELNRLAHRHGVTLATLWRRPTTLEETFLSLTGTDEETAP